MITSCQNEDIVTQTQTSNSDSEKPQIAFESITFNENGKLKLKFAEAFSNALVANKDLRRLVKEEALKQFDKDYDVLYAMVKNKNLIPVDYLSKSSNKTSKNMLQKSANAQTVREALLPFFNSEAELIEIEQKMPLLTIFVPELPLGYFSAETWDIEDETQIPDVALRLNTTNDIPVIGKDGTKYIIEAELTPGFPIVVIKENERVVLSDISASKKSNTSQVLKASNGLEFKFLDDNFNPNSNTQKTAQKTTQKTAANSVDQYLIDSYNVWVGYASGGWQRDYIYYGLTPTNTRGSINGNYREYVNSFRMTGDPKLAFNTISINSSPGDPEPGQVTEYRINRSSGWTDGGFEFRFYVFYGSQSSADGLSTIRAFNANPADLFELKYTSFTRGSWFLKKTYIRTEIVATKNIDLLDPKFDTNLEIITWDLSNYSNRWKIVFEEVDIPTKNSKTETFGSKFNTNFELNSAAGGLLEKVGLKFGASYEQTKSNNYFVEWTTQSNNLGDSNIPFMDNVINKNPLTGQFEPRTYSTGMVEFGLRPIRVQW